MSGETKYKIALDMPWIPYVADNRTRYMQAAITSAISQMPPRSTLYSIVCISEVAFDELRVQAEIVIGIDGRLETWERGT